MDWSDLHILAAIADHGSLAGAGRALGLHHVTIGRRLGELEAALGVKLVDRLPRRAALTDAGEEIAAIAHRMADLADEAARRGRGGRQSIRGSVSISAPPVFASESLAPGLAPLLAAHPELAVTLHSSASLASLARGEADIAVRLKPPEEPGLIARRLTSVDLALFATPEIAATASETWRFVAFGEGLMHTPHGRWFEHYIADRPVVLRSDDVHAIRAAARAGIGVAMLPAGRWGRDDGLVIVDDAAPPARDAWLVVHPDIRRSPAVRAVMDHITAMLADRQSPVR